MKNIIRITSLIFALLWAAACQDNGDDTGFTPADPQISFVEQLVEAAKTSGEYTVNIKSNLPWRIESASDWLSFDPANGDGDCEVTISVAANRTLDERTATVSAYILRGSDVTMTVKQAASSASDLAVDYYVKVDGSADNDGLSWETATTLAAAIDRAMGGDSIHVAAGTYIPSVPLTNMKTALDNTFEIHSNFALIGGYPANATAGARPDPVANETVLDGNNAVCHVVAVTAPKLNGMKAILKGFTIKNGTSQHGTVGSTTINGVKFYQSFGAALFVGNSRFEIRDCRISDNTEVRQGTIRFDVGSEALMENCTVADNSTMSGKTYNCGALWADACTLLHINNCTFSGNKASGVAPCIYVYGQNGTTNVLITNSTLSGNAVSPAHATRNGGGVYVRERGNLVIVNSTISGNDTGQGGGIAVYGSATAQSSATIVSCTITGNVSNSGCGLQQVNANGAVNVYNSVISGNTKKSDGTYDDALWSTGNYKISNSVIGSRIYDAAGSAVAGASFDSKTMLGALAANGGVTQTCLLLGGDNPARTYGMSVAELAVLAASLDPTFGEAIYAVDQIGTSREGLNAMGATIK